MRARVARTITAAEHDEPFARALAALMDAVHAFNRWEPGVAVLDALCEAAEVFVIERQRLIVRLREE